MGKISAIFLILTIVVISIAVVQDSENFYPILYLLLLFLLTAVPALILFKKGISLGTALIIFPTLLVSLSIFLGMGLFNIYAYIDGSLFYNLSLEFIKKAAILVLLGNLSMWLGFFWPASRRAGEKLGSKILVWTSFNTRPKTELIWSAFFIGIFTRIYLIKAGIGGYFSDESLRVAAWPYIQFLLLLESLSTLSLVAYFCVQICNLNRPKWHVFGWMLFIELITLMFIGFKGQVVYRFFYLAIAYTFITKKFNTKLIVAGILVIILITPINLRVRDQFQSGMIGIGEMSDIQRAFFHAAEELSVDNTIENIASTCEFIMRSSSSFQIFTMVMQYVDRTGIKFYGKDYLTLFTWYIPRAIWPSKPVPHKGEWVTVEIYGRPAGSSTGQTVPGDLYMNFGTMGVIAGYFLLGFFQRSISIGLLKIESLRFIPIIPFIIFALAQPQSDLGPYLAGTIKNVIFNLIVLSQMFPKAKYPLT